MPGARAAEAPEPQSQGDVRFLSGGIGGSEREAIEAVGAGYNLWLTLTAPGGAYLSDVDVTIASSAGAAVLRTTTRGPFLLVQLPAGRYRVEATQTGTRAELSSVDVPAKGQRRVVLRLAAP